MSVREKLKTHSAITNPDNVKIGESLDLLALDDSEFPRFEIRPLDNLGKGRPSQREINRDYSVMVTGYVKRPSEEVTDDDALAITDMGEELRTLIYGLIDDNTTITPPCDNFTGIDPYSVLQYDWELMGQFSTVIFGFRVEIYQNDTSM
jgi:hypothetical protein